MRPALALPLIAVLALTGCVAEPPVVLPSEEASSSPVFASDEEALAAAEEAYGAYLLASDAVLEAGGLEAKRLLPFFSDDYGEDPIAGFAIYVDRGWRTEGTSSFDSTELQQYVDDNEGLAEVVIYLCLDISGLRVFDVAGMDVTPERDERLPLEVRFANDGKGSTDLLQTGSEIWAGADFCG